jgi:hypothetical protein
MLSEGLSDRELCEALGLDYPAIVSEAKHQGISTNDFLARKTGYRLCFDFFYSPDPLLLQSDFPMIQTFEIQE